MANGDFFDTFLRNASNYNGGEPEYYEDTHDANGKYIGGSRGNVGGYVPPQQPSLFAAQLLFVFRYLRVLVEEALRMKQACAARAADLRSAAKQRIHTPSVGLFRGAAHRAEFEQSNAVRACAKAGERTAAGNAVTDGRSVYIPATQSEFCYLPSAHYGGRGAAYSVLAAQRTCARRSRPHGGFARRAAADGLYVRRGVCARRQGNDYSQEFVFDHSRYDRRS